MENKFMNGLRATNNLTYTENGAVTYKSTLDGLTDLFALGAAYRSRSVEDCILLFKHAYEENPVYALKCLFYLRDIRGGQGERRFFRVAYKWLIGYDKHAAQRNLQHIPFFGRWDDLIYICKDTTLWSACIDIIKHQLMMDVAQISLGPTCAVSLLGKWMPSENTSSQHTKEAAQVLRKALGFTPKQYRKTLSILRARINVLERLMSANEWDKIEFDKIPSKAGFKYRNAFARHDIERMKADREIISYKDFMADENTTVNAKDLYPYEIVNKAVEELSNSNWWYKKDISMDKTTRNTLNKYWENFMKSLDDFLGLDCLCVCDTSGSMLVGGIKNGTPLDVAISLSMCAAEKARGPFAGYYVSFSHKPQLIKVDGVDFVDKVNRIYQTNLCENTNIEATFDMLLNTAIDNHCTQDDLPKALVVISDMEFDHARGAYGFYNRNNISTKSLMENIKDKWNHCGYKMPHLVFWNVNARHDTIIYILDTLSFLNVLIPKMKTNNKDNQFNSATYIFRKLKLLDITVVSFIIPFIIVPFSRYQ